MRTRCCRGQAMDWLWLWQLAMGKLTLFDGDAGAGELHLV